MSVGGAGLQEAFVRTQAAGTRHVEAVQAGIVVDTVVVRGNERLTEGAVRGAGGIHSGATVTAVHVQSAIARLMAW